MVEWMDEGFTVFFGIEVEGFDAERFDFRPTGFGDILTEEA